MYLHYGGFDVFVAYYFNPTHDCFLEQPSSFCSWTKPKFSCFTSLISVLFTAELSAACLLLQTRPKSFSELISTCCVKTITHSLWCWLIGTFQYPDSDDVVQGLFVRISELQFPQNQQSCDQTSQHPVSSHIFPSNQFHHILPSVVSWNQEIINLSVQIRTCRNLNWAVLQHLNTAPALESPQASLSLQDLQPIKIQWLISQQLSGQRFVIWSQRDFDSFMDLRNQLERPQLEGSSASLASQQWSNLTPGFIRTKVHFVFVWTSWVLSTKLRQKQSCSFCFWLLVSGCW